MYIGLFLEKPIIKEGHYPEINEEHVKKYYIKDQEIATKFGELFFNEGINDYCECIVASFEYEYLNSHQCSLLKEWISKNELLIKSNNMEEIFGILIEYCTDAIKFDTGIEINL